MESLFIVSIFVSVTLAIFLLAVSLTNLMSPALGLVVY
jgi:hypothetical protein